MTTKTRIHQAANVSYDEAVQMVQDLNATQDWKVCPVCSDKPLIHCLSHDTRTNEYGDCYYCDGSGSHMCPCQDL